MGMAIHAGKGENRYLGIYCTERLLYMDRDGFLGLFIINMRGRE